MSDVAVGFSGDSERLQRAIEAAERKLAQLEGKTDDVGRAAKRLTREEQELERAAKRVFDETRTPLEQYQQKMQRLNDLVQRGKLDQETYGRAVKQAGEEMEQAGQAGEKSFGQGALGKIAGVAAGWLSVAKAVSMVTGALNDMEAAREEAAQKQRESRLDMSSLAQLAKTPEEFQALVSQARELHAAGGAESEAAAARTVFQVQSAGGNAEDVKFFGQLRSTGLVADPATMARSARTVQAAMGAEEAGSFRNLVSGALGASAFSPASAEQLLEAAARGGGSAAAIGVGHEELLAATAVAATTTGSAERGGTAVASLLKSLGTMEGEEELYEKFRPKDELKRKKDETDEEWQARQDERQAEDQDAREKARRMGAPTGGTLRQRVQQLQARGLSPAELQDILGREEAVLAFRALAQNDEMFGQATAAVGQAESSDQVATQMGLTGTDPAVRAARQREVAEAREEQSRLAQGTAQQRFRARQDEEAEFRRRRGDSEFGIGLQRRVSSAMAWGGNLVGIGEDLGEAFLPHANANDAWMDAPEQGDLAAERERVRAEAAAAGVALPGSDDLAGAAADLRSAANTIRNQRNPTMARPDVDR